MVKYVNRMLFMLVINTKNFITKSKFQIFKLAIIVQFDVIRMAWIKIKAETFKFKIILMSFKIAISLICLMFNIFVTMLSEINMDKNQSGNI